MSAITKPWRAAVVMTVALLGAGTTYSVTESVSTPPQAPITANILDEEIGDARAPSPAVRPQRPRSERLVRARSAALTAAPRTGPRTRPTRVSFPSLDVRMPITPVGVNRYGGAQIPENPSVAGWYRFGAAPGARRGAAVLMAHVDNTQRLGPLAALASLRPGDRINVAANRGGSIAYRVTRVGRVPKEDLDTKALFSRDKAHRLHVVTCGGPFDADSGGYRDNVIAVAVPTNR